MTMDEKMRMGSVRKWVIETTEESANQMGLKLQAEWSTGKGRYAPKRPDPPQYFIVLTYSEGGSDATLWFEKNELDGYPGNSKDLRRKIRDHLEKWAHGATQPL